MSQITVCPHCASSQIYVSKRGYSSGLGMLGIIILGLIGCAVGGLIGGILLGILGAFNGLDGANKIQKTCLSCGARGK